MAIQSFPSAILWDVDGVLADTTEIHFKAWQSALAEVQVLLSKDQFLSLFGRSPSDTIKGIIGPEFSEIERKRIQCRKIELY
ncbi:MAG: HAD hydrolase-like protein, partial [Methanobacterium sp.]